MLSEEVNMELVIGDILVQLHYGDVTEPQRRQEWHHKTHDVTKSNITKNFRLHVRAGTAQLV